MTDRTCTWCNGPIDARARRDSKFCGKRCRQASHRLTRGMPSRRTSATDRPMRFAYADPPHPKMAHRYYGDHPDFGGEVDHAELVDRLVANYPDGWALSTSARALKMVLDLCPPEVRVCPWFRGPRITRSRRALYGWEPLIVCGGRPFSVAAPTRVVDVLLTGGDLGLAHAAKARRSDPAAVVGAKPWEFIWWMCDVLGARPGDQLDDLFPGSGGVGRAWAVFTAGGPERHVSSLQADDGSPGPGATGPVVASSSATDPAPAPADTSPSADGDAS